MDNLRKRVNRLLSGSIHSLIGRLEQMNARDILEQTVREIEEAAAELRAEYGRAVASHHLASRHLESLREEHAMLADQALAAVNMQRDDLAGAALSRQIDIEKAIPGAEKTIASCQEKEQELSGAVLALQAKRDEMQAAIARMVEAQKQAHANASDGMSASSDSRVNAATSAFNRVYQESTGLTPESRVTSVKDAAGMRELQGLIKDGQVQNRLAALKANASPAISPISPSSFPALGKPDGSQNGGGNDGGQGAV